MNREQRRLYEKKNGVKPKKEPVINMKTADIDRMKEEAAKKAVDEAFILMLGIPTMVIHDKFGKLMKKEGREQLFADLCLDLFDSYGRGDVTLEDFIECLKQEAGVNFDRRRK